MRTFVGILQKLALATCILTLAAFFAPWFWLADLAANFPLQYLMLELLALLLLFLFPVPGRWAWTLLVCAYVNLSLILPFYLPEKGPPLRKRQVLATVKVLQLNVLKVNKRHEAVIRLIRKTNPDVVALEELDGRWAEKLAPLTKDYRYHRLPFRDDGVDVGVLSKLPLENVRVVRFGGDDKPTLHATLRLRGEPVELIVTHPHPPISPGWTQRRNRQMAEVVGFRKTLGENVIVVGDLNTTPWTRLYGNWLKDAGMKDTLRGMGIQPSWPSVLFGLGIPIDHCWVSPRFMAKDRQIGPWVGSDHLPVLIELALTTPPRR